MIVFLEVTPRWPTDSDPIRACSAADRRAQTWDGQKWAAAVYDPGSLAVSLFNGDIGSEVEGTTAPVVLSEKHLLKLFPDAKTVRWEGATFQMWAGVFTSPAGLGSYPYANTVELVAKGKVSRFEKEGGAIKLSLDPAGEAGETNVLALEYAGTSGAEGGPDLKGKLKPWIFGHAMNVAPVLINEDDSVYQFSAYGPIEAVDVLYERGASFGAATGDYANYAALVAATIPAGRWATCLAEGMIRLGAPQYGVITGDVKGDYSGSVQKRRPGAILQRIATYRGISSDAIDSDSLDALDAFATALPAGGRINLVLTEQTTFLDLARRLAAPFNAQAGFTLLGKLVACRVDIGTPTFTIDAQGRRLPVVGTFVESDTPPPYKRIVMSGQVSWRVHDLSNEIAFYATPKERGIYDDAETYREGDIVSISDGSRWIYENPVPSVGNDPTDASTYWERLSDAVTGTPGPSGTSNVVVFLYQRGATSPAAPSGTFTYTYGTGALSGGTLNGWSQSIPAADGNPLWVIAATASANTSTDTIAAAEFSSPVIKDGAGLNAATIFLYQRAASTPSVPGSTLTYTFSTAILTGTLGSWSTTAPAHDGNPLYLITATAVGAGATDTIATGEWSTPRIIASNGTDGNDAIDGEDGKFIEFVWKRAVSLPTTPTGNGIPSGWSDDPPSGTDPLWMSKAKQELTGVLVSGETWSTPIRHDGPPGTNGSDGDDGANGLNNAVVYLYQRSATSPAAPSGTFTYTFTTGVLSGGTPGSWSQSIPAANGNPLWVIAATASASTATDSIGSGEFTSPVLKDGAGLNSATVFLYQRAASAPTAPSTSTTYTFATGVLSGTLGSWTQTVPAHNGNPLYIITATALSADATDAIASGEWSAVRVLAEDGSDGTNGVNGRSLELAKPVLQILADYDGTIKSGQLPVTCKATYTDGGTDVSASTTWAKADNNTTSSIGSTGLVTITAVAGNGYVDVTGTYSGTAIIKRIAVEIVKDAAPPQSATTLTTTNIGGNIGTTSMPTSPTSNVLTMGTDASGSLQGVLASRYQVTEAAYSAGRAATMKGQLFYRLAGSGGSWSTFSGGVVTGGSSGATWTIPDAELNKVEGELNINQSQTGLTANTNYEVGCAIVKDSGSGTALDYIFGTLTVNQL